MVVVVVVVEVVVAVDLRQDRRLRVDEHVRLVQRLQPRAQRALARGRALELPRVAEDDAEGAEGGASLLPLHRARGAIDQPKGLPREGERSGRRGWNSDMERM